MDALDLALSEVPEGSARARYRYAKEPCCRCSVSFEDEGEREAAIQDAAKGLKLKAGQLSSALGESASARRRVRRRNRISVPKASGESEL